MLFRSRISRLRWLAHERLEDRRVLAANLAADFCAADDILASSVAEVSEMDSRSLIERAADNDYQLVDADGNVMYVEPLLEDDLVSQVGLADPDTIGDYFGPSFGPYPYEQTFQLSSLPEASRTIYLDFTGHTITGTPWNSEFGQSTIVIPPYNTQGSTASFSNSELDQIQWIWERVAEVYRPFNVNVTTLEPPLSDLIKSNSGDTRHGVRVTIGQDPVGSGAGGIAYLGSFNWNSDTPALVFQIGSGASAAKWTADAASHEIGHTLGLNHDGRTSPNEGYYSGHGSGATGWAPIMGVGYDKQLVQWSRGEYPNANNTENDLTKITTQNGFSYRTDDHGGSIATATGLTLIDTSSVYGEGIIERNTDLDYFSFTTGAGVVSLSITPFYRGPTLDVLATLYNSSGTVIATSNPTNTLNATINATLAAGTYYLSVDGTGKAASGSDHGYSDYASLGSYTISGTVIPAGPGSLVATLTGGTLNILDEDSKVNDLTVQFSGSNVVITDLVERFDSVPAEATLSNGNRTLTVPMSAITNGIQINTAGANDNIYIGSGNSTVSLSLIGGDGTDAVFFDGSLNLIGDKNLSATVESVSVSASNTISTGTGNIAILADDLVLESGSLIFTNGTLTIAPQTAGRAIDLGSDVAGKLSLTNTELNRVSGGVLVIGDAASGAITVSAPITRTLATNMELRSGSDVLLSGKINTNGGTLLLDPGSSPFGVKPKTVGADAAASTVSFASDLIIEINGTTVDSSYDQLNVDGSVDLAGVDLVIAGSFPGITGEETFTIVAANSITGTFTGLPDGATVNVHGVPFVIQYNAASVQLVPEESTPATISQASVYYKGTSFAGGGIDGALDTTKVLATEGAVPLTLGFDNLINSNLGLNGLVFDIDALPSASLTAGDFIFQVSPQGAFDEELNQPGDWQIGPAPTSISVIPGSTSRVVLEWADNAIANRWLRVTVKANAQTGLAQAKTFYIGHLLGETTGPEGDVFTVSFSDIVPIRAAAGSLVGASSIVDIDKSGTVSFADISTMRENVGSQLTIVTIPAAPSGGALLGLSAPGNGAGLTSSDNAFGEFNSVALSSTPLDVLAGLVAPMDASTHQLVETSPTLADSGFSVVIVVPAVSPVQTLTNKVKVDRNAPNSPVPQSIANQSTARDRVFEELAAHEEALAIW